MLTIILLHMIIIKTKHMLNYLKQWLNSHNKLIELELLYWKCNFLIFKIKYISCCTQSIIYLLFYKKNRYKSNVIWSDI